MSKLVFEIQNLTKNCNEALILSSLLSEKKHGYELAVDIEKKSDGLFKFNHGTLYPILHKLEKEGLINGIWKQEGPKRKSSRIQRSRLQRCGLSSLRSGTTFEQIAHLCTGDLFESPHIS